MTNEKFVLISLLGNWLKCFNYSKVSEWEAPNGSEGESESEWTSGDSHQTVKMSFTVQNVISFAV